MILLLYAALLIFGFALGNWFADYRENKERDKWDND